MSATQFIPKSPVSHDRKVNRAGLEPANDRDRRWSISLG